MKRTSNAFSPVIAVDRKAGRPLHLQIYDACRSMMLGGSLPTGQQLPSTRALASELNISRIPVLTAYAHARKSEPHSRRIRLKERRTGGQTMNSGNRVGSIPFFARKLILITLILLVTVPVRPSPIQHARLKLVVQVSELSNLIYQLDCLSGFANCSQNSYLHLWRSTLDWSAEDQSQLEQWRLLRAKYHGPITLNRPQFQPANLPWNGPMGLQLEEK